MKAQDTHLLTFIQNAPQFVIPIYQRNYSWTREQCGQLWNDVMRAGSDPDSPGHFIGSIVYVADRESVMSNRSPLQVSRPKSEAMSQFVKLGGTGSILLSFDLL